MEKLLPCPFCGQEATLIIHMCSCGFLDENGTEISGKHGAVKCDGCGIATTQMKIDKAISTWNTRAQPKNKPLTLNELQDMDGKRICIHYIGPCEGFCEDIIAPYYGKHEQYIHEYCKMLRTFDLPLKYYGIEWTATIASPLLTEKMDVEHRHCQAIHEAIDEIKSEHKAIAPVLYSVCLSW